MLGTITQSQWWLQSIGPNVVATIVCAVPTLTLTWLKLIKPAKARFKEHEARVRELHEHVVLKADDQR